MKCTAELIKHIRSVWCRKDIVGSILSHRRNHQCTMVLKLDFLCQVVLIMCRLSDKISNYLRFRYTLMVLIVFSLNSRSCDWFVIL